jgi:hypothetical protein
MSVQYQKQIFNSNRLKLFINLNGINPDDTANKDSISLSIYAYDSIEYKQIFCEVLKYDQILDLFNHLNSVSIIRENSKTQTDQFIELTGEVKEIIGIIQKVDVSLVKLILDKAGENEKLKLIVEALSESEIKDLEASIKQTQHQKSLVQLEVLMELEETGNITETIKDYPDLEEYSANQPEKIFQNWVEKNIWTLGHEYIKKHPAREIGIKTESDLIMETTDGFIDLIELKRPKFELFSFDSSHNCYYPSRELAKVIGQCLQYLKVLDEYKLILERIHRFKLLRPRVKIIVSRSIQFDESQFEALRMLNSNFNHLQIITFDYLLYSGKNIVECYKKQTQQ